MKRNAIPRLSAVFALLGLASCGEEQAPSAKMADGSPAFARLVTSPAAGEAKSEVQNSPPPAPAAAARKIIYTAEIDLVVEDFAPAQSGVARITGENGGYIAEMEINGSAGSQRRGRWKLRVPVDRFEAFLASVATLGVPEKNLRSTEDVTDKFFDTESRVKNKKVEEARLIKLLEDKTGKLEDVILVERELSRVRGEVEQLEGTLQKLANLTSLTTVTVIVEERKNYVPPSAPTFANTAGRTFHDSADTLVGFLKAIVLVAVAIVPWLPLVIVALAVAWLLARRLQTT